MLGTVDVSSKKHFKNTDLITLLNRREHFTGSPLTLDKILGL